MSTVSPVQSAAPATAELPTYLTPDALITYCDTRLSSLDAQMQTIFNQQEQSAATETALSNLASELNDLPQPSSSSGSNPTIAVTVEQFNNLEGAYNAAIAAAGPTTALGQQLSTDLGTLAKGYVDSKGNPVSVFPTEANANQTYSISEETAPTAVTRAAVDQVRGVEALYATAHWLLSEERPADASCVLRAMALV